MPNMIRADPKSGRNVRFGNTVDFSDTPARVEGPPPRVGEGTRQILAWLGHDDARIARLKDRSVVTWPDERYAATSCWQSVALSRCR